MKKRYPNLREQDGRYYYDHGGKPRRWEPLGRDWNKALARYHELRGGAKTEENTVEWLTARFLAHAENADWRRANEPQRGSPRKGGAGTDRGPASRICRRCGQL